MKQVIVVLSFLLAFSFSSFSQKQVRKEMREGNKDYKKEKYTEAEISYRKALKENARSADVAYNLGNSLYKQEKFQDSLDQYMAAASDEKDKEKAAMAWHNIGNVFMSIGNYKESIEAYKQALRRLPQDDETRYNLALAQKLLQEQQDQDQDQKQEQQQEQNQDQQQEPQQQNPNQMQQQNAEQILDAMMQNERETQEKVREQQMQQRKQRNTGKEW